MIVLIIMQLCSGFKTNRLSVNLKKKNFVMFGSPSKIRKLRKCEIFLDNISISRTNTAKFLGVIIDETLSWKNNINYIKGKISKKYRNYQKIEIKAS